MSSSIIWLALSSCHPLKERGKKSPCAAFLSPHPLNLPRPPNKMIFDCLRRGIAELSDWLRLVLHIFGLCLII